jgi:hypothetical protein
MPVTSFRGVGAQCDPRKPDVGESALRPGRGVRFENFFESFAMAERSSARFASTGGACAPERPGKNELRIGFFPLISAFPYGEDLVD